MLKIQEIREIIKLIDQSSIETFSYESDGAKIKLTKGRDRKQNQVVEEVIPVAQKPSDLVMPTYAEVAQPDVIQQVVGAMSTAKTNSAETNSSLHEITSPMVGTFYAAASPDNPPFAKIGDQVNADSIVCIVEAMKLFNEIESEVSGEIVEILAKDGQLVEYGQPLFLVKTN